MLDGRERHKCLHHLAAARRQIERGANVGETELVMVMLVLVAVIVVLAFWR